ncbi:glycosyltransferase [Shumkonia mesophila]|uniref:glycosyltransferase n=1 Tax=Shumkonia mesophila TaxID=2838854 RepID=UPI00293444AF|nr:glycosyltransferase [Shumkonia mesophila]
MTALAGLSLVSLLAWLWLLFLRGGFWRADQRLAEEGGAERGSWPAVAVVVPARDEAETIGATVSSLLSQDYPGPLAVIVIDDGSADGTTGRATEAASGDSRFHLLPGRPLPVGWTGKLWAVAQGVDVAATAMPDAEFLLLTDADIVHDGANLRRLVGKAAGDNLDLVSLMVHLRCESFWEKLLIPAFVFFFQKLFPFAWVNSARKSTAAAAGGCMLVRRAALEAAGGIAAIRGRLIDDCALAALLKGRGRIWLGLASKTISLRRYDRLSGIARMVARTAFEQLGNSPALLAGTLAGMIVLYAVPPAALVVGLVAGDLPMAIFGGLGWAAMTVAYSPIVRLYRLSLPRAAALPIAAVLYTVFTLESARRTWRGEGGAWKGRSYRGGVPGKG